MAYNHFTAIPDSCSVKVRMRYRSGVDMPDRLDLIVPQPATTTVVRYTDESLRSIIGEGLDCNVVPVETETDLFKGLFEGEYYSTCTFYPSVQITGGRHWPFAVSAVLQVGQNIQYGIISVKKCDTKWKNPRKEDDNTMILCIFAKTYLIVEMRLCNTIPVRLLAKNKCKRYNTLNTNDLGGGIAQQVIYLTYLHTACSGVTRRHLTDVLYPCRTRPSGMLSM